jgi:hypothetical protein
MPKRQRAKRKIKKRIGKMILKGFKIGLIVLLSLIGLQDTYAQDQPELKATTSKSKVAKNGRLRLEFTVNRQGADHFKAPNFTNFRVISGPVTSIKQLGSMAKVPIDKVIYIS